MTTDVETSRGIKAIGGENRDPDDAADITDRSKRKSTRLPASPVKLPAKQPAYLKSVGQDVVPSSDLGAPFGRDDSYRPIVPERCSAEIAADLREKSFLLPGLCPHLNDPDYCLLCGTANYETKFVEPDAEALARRVLGIKDRAKPRVTPKLRSRFIYYPTMLGIDRAHLNGLLSLQVYTWKHRIVDETQPKILRPTTHLKLEIKNETQRLEQASAQITALNGLIRELEKQIKSWAVHAMKVQVMKGERNPEDILDKPTREKFKREASKQIAEYTEKKCRLQKSIQGSRLPVLQKQLAEWDSNPTNYDRAFKTIDIPVTFREEFKVLEDGADKFNLDTYAQLMGSDFGAWAIVDKPTWAKWRRFENEILFQAMEWGLVAPTLGAIMKYPELQKHLSQNTFVELAQAWKDRGDHVVVFYHSNKLTRPILDAGFSTVMFNNPDKMTTMATLKEAKDFVRSLTRKGYTANAYEFNARGVVKDFHIKNRAVDWDAAEDEANDAELDTTENALIIKTGGAQIGASIYGAGTRWNGRQRGLSSFDNTLEYGNKDRGPDGPATGGFYHEIDSGDFGEGSEN